MKEGKMLGISNSIEENMPLYLVGHSFVELPD